MNHSVTPSIAANAPFGNPLARANGVIHPRVRRASSRVEPGLILPNPVLDFALHLSVGAAVAAGTILALFAWGGAGL
jgi:hypothetical protein